MKFLIKLKTQLGVMGILALLLAFFVFAIYTHSKADDLGNNIGTVEGKIVGTAIGSWNGVTKGIAAGQEAGKVEGMSAKDTRFAVQAATTAVGKLEVLVAGVSIRNAQKLGSVYQNLSIIQGTVVFSVDLEQAHFEFSEDMSQVTVSLPTPKSDFYADLSRTQQLAEWQKKSFKHSAQDGFVSNLNSLNEILKNPQDHISNYRSSLLPAAETAAKEKVTELIKNASLDVRNVTVLFAKEVNAR